MRKTGRDDSESECIPELILEEDFKSSKTINKIVVKFGDEKKVSPKREEISYKQAFAGRATFVKDISRILKDFRKTVFKFNLIKIYVLTLRYLWFTWSYWSTKDRLIDDKEKKERTRIMKERSNFRAGSILSQMKNFFRKNNMFHEFKNLQSSSLERISLMWQM